MNKKTVFISGIAGFLGSHLADVFLAEGHTVIGCDSLVGGDIEHVPPEADFFEYDLLDFELNKKHLKNVDTVFHTAAAAYDGLSVFSPHYITQNVFGITSSLLSASAESNVKKFVFCSSMSRYGNQIFPFTEDMPTKPQTAYGIAKVAAEQLIKNICSVHGLAYTICVPHNIIGPRQRFDDPFRNVAAIMINRMLQGEQPFIYGDGEQRRCFTFINDCVQVLEKMIVTDTGNGHTINIGPDEEYVSINQLAKTIADLLNFELQPIYIESRPQEVTEANCSADKARKLFGYQTTYSLRKGLNEMIDWMRAKGPKPFNYSTPIEIHNELLPKTWRERIF